LKSQFEHGNFARAQPLESLRNSQALFTLSLGWKLQVSNP
jgi:hypothetical protein